MTEMYVFYFFFLSGRWLKAEPAAVFESFPVRLSFNTFDAALPAFTPVFSFFAMIKHPFLLKSVAILILIYRIYIF